MDDRYEKISSLGVNNAVDANLSWIYLIIDEAALLFDPLYAVGKNSAKDAPMLQEALTIYGEILRLGRAAGVSVFTSTQKVDAMAIPRDFLSYMGCRIAMGRISNIEATMIFGDSLGPMKEQLAVRGSAIASFYGDYKTFATYFCNSLVACEFVENVYKHKGMR